MRTYPTAIIMQGGAIRGAFGAGVLFELGKRGIFVDTIAAASASVPTAAYYAARQCEAMRTIWLEELGNKHFVRYDNLFLGKPIYDIDYLIENAFKKEYPLPIESLVHAETRLVVPLYNYVSRNIEIRTSKDPDFSENAWFLIHLAMIVHDRHILWGTPFEHYVDGAIDPFALYRANFISEGTRVIALWNEPKFEMHTIKLWGQKLFLLLQARNFPSEIKRMLRIRSRLIEEGMKIYNNFCMQFHPLVIKPDAFSFLDGIDVLSRDNRHINHLFEHGRTKARAAFEAGALDSFI